LPQRRSRRKIGSDQRIDDGGRDFIAGGAASGRNEESDPEQQAGAK
jgi:hypothetical protein